MDLSKLIQLDPHPSKRLIEADRLSRSVSSPRDLYGVGLQSPEFIAQCRAGNLATSATDAILSSDDVLPRNACPVVERLDIDTLTALALLGLHHKRLGGFPPEVARRARQLLTTEEWAPAKGAVQPTIPEAVCYWAMSSLMNINFKIAAISDYLKGSLAANVDSIVRTIYEEREEIVAEWHKVYTIADGAIAIIESQSTLAMTAAKAVADVVVRLSLPYLVGDRNHRLRRVEIWQRHPGLVNFAGVHEELGALEVGWGGGVLSGESKYGSELDVSTVIRMLVKYHVNRSAVVRQRAEELLDNPDFEAAVRTSNAEEGAELLELVQLMSL